MIWIFKFNKDVILVKVTDIMWEKAIVDKTRILLEILLKKEVQC